MLLISIALELTVLLAFWLCLGVWQQERASSSRQTFLALGAAAICWCVGELVIYRGVVPELWGDRIRYMGVLSLPPLWAGLACHFSRVDLARRVPWFPLMLLVPMALPYALMYSERWSGLFMRTVPGDSDVYGPLWWVVLAYNYTLVLSGSAVLAWSALWVEGQISGLRRLAVGAAALVPLSGNAWYVWHGMEGVDPTPVLFGVALLALRGALFTGGLLDALPVSQHQLLEQLPLGVILTDRRSVVLDLNPAAERRLGIPEAKARGRSLEAVLTEVGEAVRADITSISTGDREVGQLVLIDAPEKESSGIG